MSAPWKSGLWKKGIGAFLVVFVLFLSGCGGIDLQVDRGWKQLVDSARGTEVTIAVAHSNPEYASWMTKALGDALAAHKIRIKIVAIELEKILPQLRSDKENAVERGEYDLLIFDGDGFGMLKDEELLYGPFVERVRHIDLIDKTATSFRFRDATANGGYFAPIGRKMLTLLFSEDIFYDRPQNFEELFATLGTLKGKGAYADPRSTQEGEAFLLGYISQAMDVTPYLAPGRNLEAFRAEVREAMKPLKAIQPGLLASGSVFPTKIEDLFVEGQIYTSMSMDAAAVNRKMKAYEYPDTAKSYVLPNVGTYSSIAVIPHSSNNKSGAMVVISELLSPEMQASKLEIGDMTIYHAGTPVEAMEPLQKVKMYRGAVKFSAFLDCIAPDFDFELRKIVVEEWTSVVFRQQP